MRFLIFLLAIILSATTALADLSATASTDKSATASTDKSAKVLVADSVAISRQHEKIPYKAQWVSRVKKGKLFKYKRKEFSSPRILGDFLYTGSDSGVFYAMKKKNGRKVWRFKAAGSINSTPAFWEAGDEKRILFGDDKGILYALEARRGKEIWRADLGSEILTAPAIHDDRIYAATVEGRVVALNASEGRLLWDKDYAAPGLEMTIRGNSPPVLDPSGQRLYVGFFDGTLRALSVSDGKVLWEKNFGSKKGFSDIDNPPLIEGDRLYVATFDNGLYALSLRNGSVLWNQNVGTGVRILSYHDVLYVSGSDGRLYAFQKKDGAKLWDQKIGNGALTAPVLYNNIVAVGLSESTINFLHADTGKFISHRFAKKGINSEPIIDGNRIYYLSNGGRVYSLKFVK